MLPILERAPVLAPASVEVPTVLGTVLEDLFWEAWEAGEAAAAEGFSALPRLRERERAQRDSIPVLAALAVACRALGEEARQAEFERRIELVQAGGRVEGPFFPVE